MPLILICGYPYSGKSTRATELKSFFETEFKHDVIIINEENLEIDKIDAYKDYSKEKMTRAFLKSNVEKHLNDKTIVIFDSLNYIKGYRYELFCLVRSCKTTHCILFCNTKYEVCKNNQQKDFKGFTEEMLDDFYKRMEIPNPKNRWDSPLFEVRDTEPTPLKEIAQVILFEEKKAKDPISTKSEINFKTNFISDLDKKIQEIIDTIMEEENEMSMQGIVISFKGSKQKLCLRRNLSVIELKKLKQEFISICKHHPPKTIEEVGDGFIAYLQATLERL